MKKLRAIESGTKHFLSARLLLDQCLSDGKFSAVDFSWSRESHSVLLLGRELLSCYRQLSNINDFEQFRDHKNFEQWFSQLFLNRAHHRRRITRLAPFTPPGDISRRNNKEKIISSIGWFMCCIPDYNCVLMSRAKSRGSVDTCGDCGLQGMVEFLALFDDFHFLSFLDAPFASLNRGE